jgi:hypothetical protein
MARTAKRLALERLNLALKAVEKTSLRQAANLIKEAIAALTAEQPQKVENRAILGWDMDKRLDDFTVVADALRTEGQQSRADVVTYLIERCRLAEQTPEPNRVVVSQAPIDLSKPGAIEKYVPGFGRSKEEVIPVYAAPPQPTAETEEAVNGLKVALDGVYQMPFGCSLSSMQLKHLTDAFRLVAKIKDNLK